jgi:hypothetical protein
LNLVPPSSSASKRDVSPDINNAMPTQSKDLIRWRSAGRVSWFFDLGIKINVDTAATNPNGRLIQKQ